jgi:hypothetical protein
MVAEGVNRANAGLKRGKSEILGRSKSEIRISKSETNPKSEEKNLGAK